ncbi:MAG: hypothetical protein N2510_10040 [Ignavibacteria bacterium]|nr:hypothetical protein [Ignavibacteria bacterium]
MKTFILTISVFILVFLFSCGSDTVNNPGNPPAGPDPNSINGTVNFLDSGIVPSGGYYSILAFTNWPPTSQYSALDSLEITGPPYKANYKLAGLNNGTYYLVIGWTKIPYGPGANYVLGLYNCNPPSLMCNPTPVTIENNNGVANINPVAYLDTARKIIRF